ncbi:MAG TPA: hypothetical protein VNL71_24575, partial [Chloroflexota bacterium]|nr:hypothetical protein [Chloroflexota bacterium]
ERAERASLVGHVEALRLELHCRGGHGVDPPLFCPGPDVSRALYPAYAGPGGLPSPKGDR